MTPRALGDGWEEISTALKDGEPVLGRGYYSFKPLNSTLEAVHHVEMTWYENWGQWLDPNGHAFSPTHWQPLPVPPGGKR